MGAFAYENVQGSAARDLPGHLPTEVKEERRRRFMATAERISRARLRAKVGRRVNVLVDAVASDGVAVARTAADAPEIDGKVFVRGAARLKPGDFAEVTVERADAFDLHARLGEVTLNRSAPVAPRRMHRVISR